jgi:hypothetical protein
VNQLKPLRELLPLEEIGFDSDVYLLFPQKAHELKTGTQAVEVVPEPTGATAGGDVGSGSLFEPPKTEGGAAPAAREGTLTIRGEYRPYAADSQRIR